MTKKKRNRQLPPTPPPPLVAPLFYSMVDMAEKGHIPRISLFYALQYYFQMHAMVLQRRLPPETESKFYAILQGKAPQEDAMQYIRSMLDITYRNETHVQNLTKLEQAIRSQSVEQVRPLQAYRGTRLPSGEMPLNLACQLGDVAVLDTLLREDQAPKAEEEETPDPAAEEEETQAPAAEEDTPAPKAKEEQPQAPAAEETPAPKAEETGTPEKEKSESTAKVVNMVDVQGDGCAPLHVAAYHGHVDVVQRLLLEPGIQVELLSKGLSPLELAVQQGHKPVVQRLMKHGCELRNSEAIAKRHNRQELVETLMCAA